MAGLSPVFGKIPMIYVAGPVRAASSWERALNVHRAQLCALKIQKHGAATFLPHTEFGPFTGEWSEDYVLEMCKAVISRCDAIFIVSGWEQSEGTKVEIAFAKEQAAAPVFYEMFELHKFIDWWRSNEKG